MTNEAFDQSRQYGYKQGRISGKTNGWSNGFRAGIYDTIYKHGVQDGLSTHNISLLYVTSGIGVPYTAMDEAIVRALSGIVYRFSVTSPAEDVIEAVKTFRPDLVLFLNGVVFPVEHLSEIRSLGASTAVWFTDDPYYTDWTVEIAPHYDFVFTLEKNTVELYQQLGCKHVYYMPFAHDPAQFHPKPVEFPYQTDICFIGTAYWNRVKLIDEIASHLMDMNIVIAGWWWDRLKNYQKLQSKIRLGAWMSPEETSAYYNGAKLVINLHRESDDHTLNHNSRNVAADSPNPRTFEINGCAAMQLVDARPEIGQFYEPGAEIVTFDSSQQLLDQIYFYLENEHARKEIALNGLTKTLGSHTYRRRLHHMLTLIKSVWR